MRTRPSFLAPCRAALLFLIILSLPTTAFADERSTARQFEEARRDEPSLIAFLRAMPKGADLHSHVGGALYAEDGIRHAIARGLYFSRLGG